MKYIFETYLIKVLLAVCLMTVVTDSVFAQRAKKRREGTLTLDSIMSQYAADSLSLTTDTTLIAPKMTLEEVRAMSDSIEMQLRTDSLMLTEMGEPVDTAALMLRGDSVMMADGVNIEIKKKTWLPVPSKTVWLAMAIPGAGQIYNRKYWKLPIIYGGFVGCAYALSWNIGMYKDYSQAYQDIMSDDTNNDSYMDFLPAGYDQSYILDRLEYYQTIFQKRKDLYRRQRDLSIFCFIGVYILSVIDAYVDAELSNFDISPDLSMDFEPSIFYDPIRHRPQAVGLQCNISF